MTAPVTTIADAFKRLKQSVSEDDAYDFASTKLADVWRAVREIDNKHRQSAEFASDRAFLERSREILEGYRSSMQRDSIHAIHLGL